ncbi:transposase [Coleofasciculus sp. G2-EDA-02]|uniref:transposase n=1 Tax=Coleofasciculus sp. G2-EDA-02 TaxID=3069529 RepID=UPI0032FD8EBD
MVKQYNPQIHHRRSIRLKSYDYNQAGAYFVTICVQNRECLLGTIMNQRLQLNEYGEITYHVWNHLPDHFDNLEIDAAVIMPNHFHGIIICTGLVSKPPNPPNFSNSPNPPNSPNACTGLVSKPPNPFFVQKTQLGKIIAYFKYQTTKLINQKRDSIGARFWQRNYYEHIIRNEKTLNILRQYIIDNPLRWGNDQLHPNNPSKW